MIYYVTGGARSGKSTYAEEIAKKYKSVGYIATAIATDDEMKDRIKKHQKNRPSTWKTYEQYKKIHELITNENHDVFLLDCLTIMVTNFLMEKSLDGNDLDTQTENEIENTITQEIKIMISCAKTLNKSLIIVSNEVGMGIVPSNRLSRVFRDIAGRANQLCASQSDTAFLLVSGMPIKIKG